MRFILFRGNISYNHPVRYRILKYFLLFFQDLNFVKLLSDYNDEQTEQMPEPLYLH